MSACSFDINVSSCGNPLTLLLRCYLLKKNHPKCSKIQRSISIFSEYCMEKLLLLVILWYVGLKKGAFFLHT